MRVVVTGENEAGKRLDSVLMKYMDKSPSGFIYKMLRKKNITLNGRKADGGERLKKGDEIRLYLSDETIEGFTCRRAAVTAGRGDCPAAANAVPEVAVVYEDKNVIFFNKPAGMLSQKAKDSDYSLCEYLIDYMLKSGEADEESLRTFRPGVCNRLDRNTGGLVAAGKTLVGLRTLNSLFKTRELHKSYRAIAVGEIRSGRRIEGWLLKDPNSNRVRILKEQRQGAARIETEYTPIASFVLSGRMYTYVEINLITGKSHQIRAHLSSIGYPLAGDSKYGIAAVNRELREAFGVRHQLLHSYSMKLPVIEGELSYLSGKEITAPLPEEFNRILCAVQDV